MAAPEGNKNSAGHSKGKGGKSLQDREQAARVRRLALSEIEKILITGRKDKLFDPVLLKLAGTLLPRLNEHSGPDGEKLIEKDDYKELTNEELRRRIEKLEGGGHEKGIS